MNLDCYTPKGLFLYYLFTEELPIRCQENLTAITQVPNLTVTRYLYLFILTVLLECIIYLCAMRSKTYSLTKKIWIVIALNLATHPIVTFLAPVFFFRLEQSTSLYLLSSEIFAPLLEGLLLQSIWKLPVKMAILTATLANLFSWWGGLICVQWINSISLFQHRL